MRSINRRQNPRIDVRLKCHGAPQRWWSKGFAGETCNISRNGVLLVWQPDQPTTMLPRVGDLLTMDIELPANHDFGRKCIHCQGTVVRIGASETQELQVALSVNYMKFRDYARRVAPLQDFETELTNWTS